MGYSREHDEHRKADGGNSASVVYIASYLGEITVEICDTCFYEIVTCSHTINTWNDEKTELTCNLCGANVT
jgi:hypothetical protein